MAVRTPHSTLLGPLIMLSAALQFAVMDFTIKLLGPYFSAWHIAFYRFSGSIIVVLLLFGRHRNPYRGVNYKLLILRGVNGSLGFLTIAAAIHLLPLSTAMVIFYTYPVFAAFFSVWLYGDRIRMGEGGCILAVVIGAGLLFEFRMAGLPIGELLALAGAMFFGLSVTLIRSLRKTDGPVIIYLYFSTMGMLVTLPAFLRDPRLPVSGLEWLLCLTMILFSVAAQISMNHGFFYCRSWEGGVFMTMETVFTVLAGVIIL
ncbi:MAG: DMT family transporter, partial [Thermodesulfobacteriota bacterium]